MDLEQIILKQVYLMSLVHLQNIVLRCIKSILIDVKTYHFPITKCTFIRFCNVTNRQFEGTILLDEFAFRTYLG